MKSKLILLFLILLSSFSYSFYYRLTWDVEGNLFRIYRSIEGSEFVPVSDISNNIYLETDILEGTTYSYYVVAVNEWGVESEPSNTLDVYTGYIGDSNGDDLVTYEDKLNLAGYLAGNGNSIVLRGADINNDFQVNLLDLMAYNNLTLH